MAERVRLTISVAPEVHEAYSRMAELLGVSLSRAMGDWLGDTAEAAQLVTVKLREAKQAPQRVLRELEGVAIRARDDIDRVLVERRQAGAPANGEAGRGGAGLVEPPHSPTGVKGRTGRGKAA